MPSAALGAAAREIQKRHPTPAVVHTVYAGRETALPAGDAGRGAYLVKPATAPERVR